MNWTNNLPSRLLWEDTSVIDLETGESLFVEAGSIADVLDTVIAVRTRYPHTKVVFDPFHIVKNYNDRVISELRKREQRHLKESIEQAKKAGNTETQKALEREYTTLQTQQVCTIE